MANVTFNCSKCGVEIEVDESFGGSAAQCPNCNSTVLIPTGLQLAPEKWKGGELFRKFKRME